MLRRNHSFTHIFFLTRVNSLDCTIIYRKRREAFWSAKVLFRFLKWIYYKAKEEHRPETENPDEVQEAEIIIAKHRNGPTGKVMLGFQPSFARFRNLERPTFKIHNED